MILDTTFVIDLMSQLPDAIQKLQELQHRQVVLYITTPTIVELWSRILQSSRQEQEKRKVVDIIASQLVLELSESCAEEAGKIDGTLYKEGIPVDPIDCMIAGIARHQGDTLLTKNLKHFGRIKGLKVETY